MAKTKNDKAAAAKAAQDVQDAQKMSQDTQAQEAVPETEETEFIEYAVTAAGGLRLREEPSLDAPVVAVLPCGVGVLGNTRPAENGWRQVFTGRLFGWMLDKFLEPLELSDDAE